MNAEYEAVIVGGGHNGLAAAALLSKAGRRVLVLEQRDVLGGAAATEPLCAGFRVSSGAHDAHMLRPELVAELDLRRHGLEFVQSPALLFSPQPDGSALTLWRDMTRSQAEIARYSASDAEKYPAFVQLARRLIGALDGVMLLTPPNLGDLNASQAAPWARVALGARRLGERDMMTLLRVLPMPVAEWLDEWFESDALKGALGAAGVVGGPFGPLASGTAFMLLYQRLGPAGGHQFVCGGLGQLSAALASAARQHGAEIRAGAHVARIVLRDDGAEGAVAAVELASGERIPARRVLSSADPRRTLFGLVGPDQLEPRFMRRVRSIRFRGATAKVNLALSGLPRFVAGPDPAALGGHIVISPSLEYLERGADDAKYGRPSARPMLDATIPTLLDPSLAPQGQHVMSVTVQWAPYRLREADWDSQREAFGDSVVAELAAYAPGLEALVLQRQVLTPLDWERDYGLTEGSIFQGEMGLDQLLFMRPVAGYGQYRTPIAGLYLCGAGAHPGGGVTGAPGYNAAREVLKDIRQAR